MADKTNAVQGIIEIEERNADYSELGRSQRLRRDVFGRTDEEENRGRGNRNKRFIIDGKKEARSATDIRKLIEDEEKALRAKIEERDALLPAAMSGDSEAKAAADALNEEIQDLVCKILGKRRVLRLISQAPSMRATFSVVDAAGNQVFQADFNVASAEGSGLASIESSEIGLTPGTELRLENNLLPDEL